VSPTGRAGGLHEVLAMGGWRAWILDGEDRVLKGLGCHEAPIRVGETLDAALGDVAEAARTALAELEASGVAAPRPLARDASREVMAFTHQDGRAVGVRKAEAPRLRLDARDRVGVLLGAAEGLGGAATEEEVLKHLAEVAGQDLGDGAGVWKRAGESLVLRSGWGLPDLLPLEIAHGPSALWEVLQARAPLVTGDVLEDPRFQLHAADRLIQSSGARAVALLPLRTAGRDLGILLVAWRSRGLPTTELLRALRQLASIGAVALDRAGSADDLAAQHRLLQAVLDAASDGVLGLDRTRKVVFGNLRAQQLLGRSEAELAALGWADLLWPDPATRLAALQALVAGPQDSLADPIDATLEDDERPTRELQLTSTRCAGPGGEPLTLVFLRDVTERRRARARAMAEQNFTRLGRLAGGIAHDFNNLLGAILGHADLIRNAPRADDHIITRATTIAQAAVRGSRLSNRLLAFSGSGTIRPQPVDLEVEVQRGVRLFRSTLPVDVDLTTVVGIGLVPALADAGQFYQALVNLLANARDAVGASGRIQVRIELASPPDGVAWASPELDRTGDFVRVSVQDSGAGFTRAAQRHLFEPFFTTKTDGHGLGLSAVQGILAAHGGALDVRNQDGAVVELYLPAAPQEQAAADPQGPDRIHQQMIWAVDDETVLLEFIDLALGARGYRVVSFSDPQQALDAARECAEPPVLLVLDVVMPGLTGPQLLVELRKLPAFAPLPVIWSSGYSPDSVDLGETGDDVVFLQKPYTGRELARTIQGLVVPGNGATR